MLFYQAFFSLDTLPHTSVSLTSCISIVFSVLNILTNDHYAACWVTLRNGIIPCCFFVAMFMSILGSMSHVDF